MLRRVFFIAVTLVIMLAAGWLALKRSDIAYPALETVYMSDSSQFLTLDDGLKIHYRDDGNPDGETLLLVHGFASSVHSWEPLVAELEDEYRLISVDLPSHGLSRLPKAVEETGMAVFQDALVKVTEQLELDQFTLIGSSMGGDLAWRYALERPDTLEGLVLIGASGWAYSDAELSNQSLLYRAVSHPFAHRFLKDIDSSLLIQWGLRSSFSNPELATPDMVERYVALSRAPGHRAGILATLADRPEPADPAALARLRVPTLVLQGDADERVPLRMGQLFADTIPDARLIVYTEAGHLLHEEQPGAVAEHISSFLDAHNETRPRDYSAALAAGLQP